MNTAVTRIKEFLGPEIAGPGLAFVAVMLFFSLASPQFLSSATFGSVAFQLPELGLLTLAMLLPVLTGGLNLAITFTANLAGLTVAWVLQVNGGVDAGMASFVLGCILAIAVGRCDRCRDGSGDSLYARSSHSRLAVDDDLCSWSR